MALSFASPDSRSRLDLLVEKNAAFKASSLDKALADELCNIAWSLCDWIYKEHGLRLGFTDLRQFQRSLKSRCPELPLIQDLANGSKHKTITLYTPVIKEAKLHGGAFSSEFSRDFDISRLVIVKVGDEEVDFEDAIDTVVNFWVRYCHENTIA